MDKQTVEQRAADLLAPFPGPNRAGENAAYDSRYEDVKREVAKLNRANVKIFINHQYDDTVEGKSKFEGRSKFLYDALAAYAGQG